MSVSSSKHALRLGTWAAKRRTEDTYGLLDFVSPCVTPAETILEVTSGFLARARWTADAAAADGSCALPVPALVLTLARISGRDWKYL